MQNGDSLTAILCLFDAPQNFPDVKSNFVLFKFVINTSELFGCLVCIAITNALLRAKDVFNIFRVGGKSVSTTTDEVPPSIPRWHHWSVNEWCQSSRPAVESIFWGRLLLRKLFILIFSFLLTWIVIVNVTHHKILMVICWSCSGFWDNQTENLSGKFLWTIPVEYLFSQRRLVNLTQMDFIVFCSLG